MPGEMVYEKVPRFLPRQGDVVLSGRSNATVVLGRDRMDTVDSGRGAEQGTGAITLVVGRLTHDPSLDLDGATLYISELSEPDSTLGTTAGPAGSVAVIRADRVLLVTRDELQIKVGQATLTMKRTGEIVLDGDISLGDGAIERVVKESFGQWATTHIHPDPVSGFSGPPTVPPPDSCYSTRSKAL